MILTDDNLLRWYMRLKKAVTFTNNIKKSVMFQLSCNLGEVYCNLVSPICKLARTALCHPDIMGNLLPTHYPLSHWVLIPVIRM
jgi:hypothetical protein